MFRAIASLFVSLSLCASVIAADLPMETLDQRLLELEGAQNFRDMGGYPTQDGRTVKWGELYRSDALNKLTESDWAKVNALGINVVCDFRANEERERWASGWQQADLDMLVMDYSLDVDELQREGYQDIAKSLAPLYVRMFDRLSDPDAPPSLIHCTAGQDRTGFGAAFILTVLGVDRDIILDDYSLSQWLRGKTPPDPEYIAELIEFYDLDMDVDSMLANQTDPNRRARARAQLETAFSALEQQYGSVEAFIRTELDVDDMEIAQLRARLLED